MCASATAVSFDPQPAITGTGEVRVATATAAAAATQAPTTSLCCSIVRVADSPVVPHGTSALDPARTCQSTKASNAAQSTPPSTVNGVTNAGIEP